MLIVMSNFMKRMQICSPYFRVFSFVLCTYLEVINGWNLAVLVDVPWTELPDFTQVVSDLGTYDQPIDVHRFDLSDESNWQVTCFPQGDVLSCDWRIVLKISIVTGCYN